MSPSRPLFEDLRSSQTPAVPAVESAKRDTRRSNVRDLKLDVALSSEDVRKNALNHGGLQSLDILGSVLRLSQRASSLCFKAGNVDSIMTVSGVHALPTKYVTIFKKCRTMYAYLGVTMAKAREHFNDTADRYEERIEKIIPYAELFFGMSLDCMLDGSVSVLELGSGTGYVTEQVLRRNPEARVTCIDMTPEMLAVARSKPKLEDVTFLEGDFRDVWPDERFDVVITTLCLHHLPDADRATVIRRISATLNGGGRFINGDIFRPENEWEEALYRNRWRRYMVKHGLPITDAERMIEMRGKSYQYIDTLRGYRQKLADAGFRRIYSPYSCYFTGVFVAAK